MLQVVGEYRSFITGDALVKDADDNPFGVNVAVRKTMVTVLDNVTTQLSG
jgi:hypothetical protein